MVQWLQEIQDIVQEYKSHYRRNLEKDVVSETSGHFKRLLVSMCQVTAWEYPCAWGVGWGWGGRQGNGWEVRVQWWELPATGCCELQWVPVSVSCWAGLG